MANENKTAPSAPAQADVLAQLKALLAQLKPEQLAAVLPASAQAQAMQYQPYIPEGFELTKKSDVPAEETPAARKKFLEQMRLKYSKSVQQITQDAADELFKDGTRVFECRLIEVGADGEDLKRSSFPTIRVKANADYDARARYMMVNGIAQMERGRVMATVVAA